MVDATILETTEISALWAPWFKNRATWQPWFAFLKVLFGLPVTDADRVIAAECLGTAQLPVEPVREAWLVCGRRAGKSFVLALIAAYLAVFKDWRPYLSPGEVGTIKVLAVDRRQARVIYRYAHTLLHEVPALAELIHWSDGERIELKGGIEIEIQTASYRSVRGYTIIAALCDEIAFWRSEDSANPDTEILDALRPAMGTMPGAMLLCASSPYARRGALYRAYRRYWGGSGKVLIWKAATRTMNPTVSEELIAEAYEEDPAAAAAEFGAEFRTDIESYINREVVEALVVPGRYELPPFGEQGYCGFVDPSGGSVDSMTLAIAHREGIDKETRVLDLVREVRPPFSPAQVVEEFCAILHSYRLTSVCGDRYAGEWAAERFRHHGIYYRVSEKTKSEIYVELLPLLMSRRCELLDNRRLLTQLCSLERRTGRGTGRDSVDHPPHAHDDVCNAAAGALTQISVNLLEAWGRW